MALFRSPNHAGFVQNVRDRIPTRWNNVTGEPIEHLRRLEARFGVFGNETTIYNPETGRSQVVADVRGGFFDSVAMQEQEGWSDEEREAVEETLRETQRKRPDYVQEIIPVQVAAPVPWANYDDAKATDVPKLAEALGLVPEALRYERENQARATTMGALIKMLEALGPEAVKRSQPLMQFPDGSMVPTEGHGVSIGRAPETTETGIVKSTPGFVEKPAHQVVV